MNAEAWRGRLLTVFFAVLSAVRSRLPEADTPPHFRMGTRGQSSPRRTAATAAGIVGSVGLVGLIEQYGFGGIAYALFLEIIGGIQGFGAAVTRPFEAFGAGFARVVAAVFPARIINAAADFTAFELTRGDWAFFGPLTFAVGVIATLAGVYVFVAALRKFDLTAFGALLDRR